MNYRIFVFLNLSLLISAPLFGAVRPALRSNQITDENIPNSPQQVLMIPVSVPQQRPSASFEEQRDRDFFITLLSVAAHFGNALLNKENKPVLAQHLGSMASGIVQAADIITRFQKQYDLTYEQLCTLWARIFSEQAQQNVSRVRLSSF